MNASREFGFLTSASDSPKDVVVNMSISPVNCKHSFISCEKRRIRSLYVNKERSLGQSPSLSILLSKTQWLSGLYYADFITQPLLNCAESRLTNQFTQLHFCPSLLSVSSVTIFLQIQSSDPIGLGPSLHMPHDSRALLHHRFCWEIRRRWMIVRQDRRLPCL